MESAPAPAPGSGNGRTTEPEPEPEQPDVALLDLHEEDRLARLRREGKLRLVAPPRPSRAAKHPAGIIRKPKAPKAPKAPKTSTAAAPSITASRFETGPEFMTRVSALPPLAWHAEGLIPSEGVTLFHGRPRAMKSLSLLRIALDLALGDDLFGASRFHVAKPVRVLYLTEEDPDRLLWSRMEMHRRGLKAERIPDGLFFSVRRGWSLDNSEHRLALRKELEAHDIQVAILEPMRSLTAAAEGTAADFKEVGDWIRSVQAQTACKTFVPAAHWRKPQQWERKGGEELLADKVAGGALFSFSDCLIGCEKLSWNSAVLLPTHYKLGSDPKPFVLTWTTEEQKGSSGESLFGDWIAPEIDEAESLEEVRGRQDRLYLLEYIAENPWQRNLQIAEGAKKSPNMVLAVLSYLIEKKLVVCVKHKSSKRYAKVGEAFDPEIIV